MKSINRLGIMLFAILSQGCISSMNEQWTPESLEWIDEFGDFFPNPPFDIPQSSLSELPEGNPDTIVLITPPVSPSISPQPPHASTSPVLTEEDHAHIESLVRSMLAAHEREARERSEKESAEASVSASVKRQKITHISAEESDSEQILHECNTCGRSFPTLEQLKRHTVLQKH